jgi:hypothetical protein
MARSIENIAYRSGFLPPDAKPDTLSVQTWRREQIPSAVRQALSRVNLPRLHGVYGNRTPGQKCEYDQLRIIWEDRSVTIEVFGRTALIGTTDGRFQQVHRILCKLNKAMMAVPDVFTPEQRMGADPELPLPPGGKFTYRDQANVMTLLAFRNGPIEDLHAGAYSPLLEDKTLSRITDAEMKALMIAASTKLAELLALRDEDPERFTALLAGNWRQVRNWER